MKHSYSNDDTCFSIDVIDEILEEDFDALLDEGSKILYSIERTLLEEEIFAEFDEFMEMTADENSDSNSDTEDPPFEKITINTDYKIKHLSKNLLRISNLNLFLIIWNIPWVSPIHYVPKKGGITVVTNENDELVPTRTVTGWQIPIDPNDQEKIAFTCPFGTYAYRRMPFGLCHIPKVYVGNLSRYDRRIRRNAHLVLNWEKCHFMVKEGIVLGHKVSSARLEVDKAKINVISKLSPLLISKVEPS
ncbi:hypothetical protein Tco_1346365 [Tanacetum coccineum]